MLQSTCVHTKTLYMVVFSYKSQLKYDQRKYALTLLLSQNCSIVIYLRSLETDPICDNFEVHPRS